MLGEELRTKGVDVTVMDLARSDMSEAVAQAFRYSKLVLASPPTMARFSPSPAALSST